ncbi:hypothetical protein [Kitasatospora purpeofusca]|uniref:hypothetical protein n=1 Tax=Kitasatospora purpeofusca TaxID=67352 RepID=UPI00225A7649|nr:hypothetical protein [Kitasatospora purpeofusca]MCX4690328.1 RNA ligase family protein [Kitasatospora purpeofusca]
MEEEPKRRGRPRKDPERLARWTPPDGWSRLVAWISPEEKKALKRVAVDAEVSVADLVRALASGLATGAITHEELVGQVRRGRQVMEKIPTLFERDGDFRVMDRPRAECAWVFAGEGAPTEKLDGTNVRLTVRGGHLVRVEKRRNPSKAQKQQGIVDGWYVDTDRHGPEDRWILTAADSTDVTAWPDGEHACEALGPRIQGNPLELDDHLCVPFDLAAPVYTAVPRSYDGLREFLAGLESRYAPGTLAEGIVFHHPDGRRAKIKRKDFPAAVRASTAGTSVI